MDDGSSVDTCIVLSLKIISSEEVRGETDYGQKGQKRHYITLTGTKESTPFQLDQQMKIPQFVGPPSSCSGDIVG